ncbi:hypothetical protein FN846DRAFT_903820 [Sphaerosporella brunnea]|uniref:Uncharacterized protein n=1 Tax=Sphaerosporella brunnea TaxID=1250544 RepID=A0A5J5F601_9PEZI|nr:hypothetical protein FN846DRAFT_903820 [Sphaerosporella brunnea]
MSRYPLSQVSITGFAPFASVSSAASLVDRDLESQLRPVLLLPVLHDCDHDDDEDDDFIPPALSVSSRSSPSSVSSSHFPDENLRTNVGLAIGERAGGRRRARWSPRLGGQDVEEVV